MDNELLDDDLKSVLQRWLDKALIEINNNWDTLIGKVGLPRWYKSDQGYIRSDFFVFEHFKLRKLIFWDSDEWAAVKNISSKNPDFAAHVGNLIPTGIGEKHTFSLESLCKKLLPQIDTNGQEIFLERDFNKEERINQLIEAISTKEIISTFIWPICGIKVNDSVFLDDRTQIRKLTNREKISCLDLQIIKPSVDNMVNEENADWYGLIRNEKFPKIKDAQKTLEINYALASINERELVLEDFLAIISLIGNNVAYHGGGYSSAPILESNGILSSGMKSINFDLSSRFIFSENVEPLTEKDLTNLKDLWGIIRNNKNDNVRKRLINAAKRLLYAETRHKAEDKLIDCMIAAESIYLEDNKGELKYRLGLNAAMWSDNTEKTKEEIVTLFNKAYNLRSKIVHGSFVNLEDLNSILLQVTTELKLSTVKAFKEWEKGFFPPEWVKMLLNNK